MPLNSSGPISLAGTTVGVSIQKELGGTGTTQISLNDAAVRSLAGIASGAITMPTNFWGKGVISGTQKGITAYGSTSSAYLNVNNLISSSGVVAANGTSSGTARANPAACTYGTDKSIFVYGANNATLYGVRNLVSNTGVFAAEASSAGTARSWSCAVSYGTGADVGLVAYGKNLNAYTPTLYTVRNQITNTGVVGTDTSAPANSSNGGITAGAMYGGDKAIMIFYNAKFLVSNTGVIGSQESAEATRDQGGVCTYGGDKAIWAYGYISAFSNSKNLISNTGVIASESAGAGTGRLNPCACGYGGDKGIFLFGYRNGNPLVIYGIYNTVTNTGDLSSDIVASGATARYSANAAGISLTA